MSEERQPYVTAISLLRITLILVVLMKLRIGLLNKDIAHRFGMQTSTISNIYRSWLPVISSSLQNLIVWPDRANIRKHIPSSFTHKFRDCICTIDCSEIFTERPSNLTARAQTWSNYKHNNTIKYLIGISPAGAVTFLSAGWGGRVSDKQITMDSGFLDKLSPGDCILADRGFLIAHEVNARGASKLFHACSVILLRFYLDQCIKSIIPGMQNSHLNSHLAANIIILRFMAIYELLLRQMYGPWSAARAKMLRCVGRCVPDAVRAHVVDNCE